MRWSHAVNGLALLLAVVFVIAGRPAFAQDPEPPIEDRWAVDLTIGSLPFNPGQTFSFVVPTSIPDLASDVLVLATFTCSLISGQGGMMVQWTIWTPILHGDGNPNKASFQSVLWCPPGQLTTNQAMEWLPITAASRTVFAHLDTTGTIPWDNTQSTVKIVSYK